MSVSDLTHASDVFLVPIDKCVPNDWNPNEMTRAAFDRLVKEIKETGMINPIHVVPVEDGTYRIIGGEHRWRAARALGHETIECKVLTEERFQDEDLQKFINMRQNMLRGEMNPEKFARLYEDMARRYSNDALRDLMAVTDEDEWRYYVDGVEGGLESAGLPKDMVNEFKERVQEVNTVDDLGRVLNDLFSHHGDDLQWSFMVFTFGGREHYYIKMNDRMMDAMHRLSAFCRENDMDINLPLVFAIEDLGERLQDEGFAAECRLRQNKLLQL